MTNSNAMQPKTASFDDFCAKFLVSRAVSYFLLHSGFEGEYLLL